MENTESVESLLKKWTPLRKNISDFTPAELFDKHPLSEMLLGSEDVYKKNNLLLILNSWKSEWHKDGVQVPVKKNDELIPFRFRKLGTADDKRRSSRISLPDKLRRESMNDYFNSNIHCLADKPTKTSFYNLDDLDYAWISTVNEERECLGQVLLEDWMLESLLSTLEYLAYVKMHEKIKEIELQDLEFDENARCDICLSFEGEDGNELVFCDGCLLCVHQACYGIINIPEGSWMCRQCEAGIKSTTPCLLCPNTGGAMKLSDDGKRWCHVSCALWVPEVGFGSIDLMEPIVRLDSIPQARKNLLCSICRSRYGAPVQCSNKKCKIAFHVTCAFQSNLVMRQELVDKDGLCTKHSRKETPTSSSSTSPHGKLIKNSNCSSKLNQESNHCASNLSQQPRVISRKQKLLDLETNFYKLVDENSLAIWINGSRSKKQNCLIFQNLSELGRIPSDIRSAVLVYWRLKRRSNFNQPLINPLPLTWKESVDEISATTKEALAEAARAASDMEAFGAFRRIRFGLDRSRLVVDMVLQRERRKLALFKRIWRISDLQLNVFVKADADLLKDAFVSSAHMGESIYDNWQLFGQSCSTNKPNSTSDNHHGNDKLSPKSKFVGQKLRNTREKVQGNKIKRDKLHAVLVPKENFIVTDAMKHRLRSALTLVTNNYCFSGSGNSVLDKSKKSPVANNFSSKRSLRCGLSQYSTAPKSTNTINGIPVVSLPQTHPSFKYCNDINLSMNGSPSYKLRTRVYQDGEVCENNNPHDFGGFTRMNNMLNITSGNTKYF